MNDLPVILSLIIAFFALIVPLITLMIQTSENRALKTIDRARVLLDQLYELISKARRHQYEFIRF